MSAAANRKGTTPRLCSAPTAACVRVDVCRARSPCLPLPTGRAPRHASAVHLAPPVPPPARRTALAPSPGTAAPHTPGRCGVGDHHHHPPPPPPLLLSRARLCPRAVTAEVSAPLPPTARDEALSWVREAGRLLRQAVRCVELCPNTTRRVVYVRPSSLIGMHQAALEPKARCVCWRERHRAPHASQNVPGWGEKS